MRVLLSNDDGVHAPGLAALAAAFEGDEVWVVAPDREQSASSHAISLHRPLRLVEVGPRRYAVDGTPTDAVYMGLNLVLRGARPDIVVSGVNHGPNLGNDVLYSGTVAAAMEAALLGVNAIAVSLAAPPPHDFDRGGPLRRGARAPRRREPAARAAAPQRERPARPGARLPVRPARPPHLRQRGRREDRPARPQVLLDRRRGRGATNEDIPGSDCNAALLEGLVAVTPLHLDSTHDAVLQELRSWTVPGLREGAGAVRRAGAPRRSRSRRAPRRAPRSGPPRAAAPPPAGAPPPLSARRRRTQHDEPALAGVVHVVRRGETVYRIARAYGIDPADLMETNGIADPRDRRGRARSCSCPARAASWTCRPRRSAGDPRARARAGPGAARPRRDRARRPRRRPDGRRGAPTAAARDARATRRSRGRSRACSTAGTACAPGGATTGSTSPRPRARRSAPPRPGRVIYAGEQAGYGAIVILRHEGGLVTLYAHNSRLLVDEGERVARGEPIARVGQTGRTTGPHLHFEVREGTRPRNPLLFLP